MANDSIAGILADARIRLKSQRPGHQEQVVCPQCSGGSHKEASLSVKVDPDGQGVTWNCKRASCGHKGGAKVHQEPMRPDSAPRPTAPLKPTVHTPAQSKNRPDWLYAFFDERNIGPKTVDHFGIYAVNRHFGAIGNSDAIVFPYRLRGEVVNRKYRPYPAKNPQMQEPNALPTLFNIDSLGEMPPDVYFVEGEPDVMAMHECGFTRTVSLKDGAPSTTPENSDKRYEAMALHAEILAKARKIVLAGDMDPPGLALREELARRLGRHLCWFVTWPDGCKDACDTLRKHGLEAVQAAVKAAEPYPIDGLHRILPGSIAALRARPRPKVMATGVKSTDAVLSFPAEGRVIVVTGYPGHGKTSWTRFVMVYTATNHGRRWAVFSPESQPWEQFVGQCAEVFIGKPLFPEPYWDTMNPEEIERAEVWLGDRVTMLVCDAESQEPTLDWLLERAQYAVLRDGVTDFLFDPWNEVAQERGTLTETEFIGRCLQRCRAFGLRYGCNVWIIAHPAKPQPLKAGEKRAVPGPYDISGSSHWANKADLGLTLHSSEKNKVELHIWKARHRRWGVRGTAAAMLFEPVTGRYRSVELEDEMEDAQRRWDGL